MEKPRTAPLEKKALVTISYWESIPALELPEAVQILRIVNPA